MKGIEEQTRKWAGLKQDNLLMITENSSPVNNTHKPTVVSSSWT